MKLISWNVNGVRAALKHGLRDFLDAERPDLVCLQEVRATEADLPATTWPARYRAIWNPATKRGYSGVLTLTRREPLAVARGIGIRRHDLEGRVLTTEFADFFLVNVYVPNSQRELTRLEYRREWDRAFLAWLRRRQRIKPVVLCGDLNVAHQEIDLARPKDNVHNHGFTPEERAGFDALVRAGFVDTFRVFHSGPGHYTWWSQMHNARARNLGWRIDYFLCSEALRPRLKSARIYAAVHGSDHCPVGLEMR